MRKLNNVVAVPLMLSALLIFSSYGAYATETTFFTDSHGRSTGSADRFGDITFYNDAQGRPIGSSTRFGNQTFYDDAYGRSAGSSTTFGGDD